jgi:hypothetical protein
MLRENLQREMKPIAWSMKYSNKKHETVTKSESEENANDKKPVRYERPNDANGANRRRKSKSESQNASQNHGPHLWLLE